MKILTMAAAILVATTATAMADNHGHENMHGTAQNMAVKMMHNNGKTAVAKRIHVDHAWARPTIGSSKNSAAFMHITNKTAQDDMLVNATSSVAKKVEIHETKMDENGVMKMMQMENIALGQGKTVVLKPGSYHVMLMGLHKPLKVGDEFIVTLKFENSKDQNIKVEVKPLSSKHNKMMKHMKHGMDHGKMMQQQDPKYKNLMHTMPESEMPKIIDMMEQKHGKESAMQNPALEQGGRVVVDTNAKSSQSKSFEAGMPSMGN